MASSGKKYDNIVESLVSIFTIEDGFIKVLLLRKKEDPYKGYWMLPGSLISKTETVEETLHFTIEETLGLKGVLLKSGSVSSSLDRHPEGRVIAISCIGMIDNVSVSLQNISDENMEFTWFSIRDIPKMAYDHLHILEENIHILKETLKDFKVLKSLFPSDFTLPELHQVYENITNQELDRRNFRKKLVTLDLIEDTGEKNLGGNGRPAKLYRFK